jgi:hypothetical protein
MPAKTPNPLIEEILKASENSLIIVKNPNGLGDDTFRVYSSGDHAALLDNKEELKGFEKSLKMQKVTARLAVVASDDWDISWAWSLQAKTETLDELLKSADKLEMEIALTDETVGELTKEDAPRTVKKSSDGLVTVGGVGAGSGIWSGNQNDFEDLMKKMGVTGFDDEKYDRSETPAESPSADDLIKAMLDGDFEGDPIEGLFEIGKALSEEGEAKSTTITEDDENA